jgi:hypothetical protein
VFSQLRSSARRKFLSVSSRRALKFAFLAAPRTHSQRGERLFIICDDAFEPSREEKHALCVLSEWMDTLSRASISVRDARHWINSLESAEAEPVDLMPALGERGARARNFSKSQDALAGAHKHGSLVDTFPAKWASRQPSDGKVLRAVLFHHSQIYQHEWE